MYTIKESIKLLNCIDIIISVSFVDSEQYYTWIDDFALSDHNAIFVTIELPLKMR